MKKEKIGVNAGIVWRTLDESQKQKLSFTELEAATGLSQLSLAAAIGWLSREDKLDFTMDDDGVELISVYHEQYY